MFNTWGMWFFSLLYALQGAAFAYVVNFQKPYLARSGVSLATLGLFTSVLLLPFLLKVPLGVLSDRWRARKSLMLVGLALFSGAYLTLTRVGLSDFLLFAGVTWLASLGLALFDTCADGWAIDQTSEARQSAMQAAMVAGKAFGVISMSFVFGRLEPPDIFLTLGLFGLSVAVVVGLMPYRPRERRTVEGGAWPPVRTLIALAGFGIVYSVASFGTDGVLTLRLSQLADASTGELGTFGVARGVGALIGAFLFALIARRRGASFAERAALWILGLGCLLPLAPLGHVASGVLWGACWSFQETAYVTLAMRIAEGPRAASVFALAMIFSNLGTALGEAVVTPLSGLLPAAALFTLLAGMAWSGLLLRPEGRKGTAYLS